MEKTACETKHTSPKMVSGQGEMKKTEFGALRESNQGRGRFDLIPYEAVEALAKWYEAGAEKYDERNWESGISVKDCINRMCRHASKVASGWTDEDHLAAVMWNAAAAITMMQRKPECNDHTWHPKKPYTPEFMVKEVYIPQKETDLNHKCIKALKDSLAESMGIEGKLEEDSE